MQQQRGRVKYEPSASRGMGDNNAGGRGDNRGRGRGQDRGGQAPTRVAEEYKNPLFQHNFIGTNLQTSVSFNSSGAFNDLTGPDVLLSDEQLKSFLLDGFLVLTVGKRKKKKQKWRLKKKIKEN